MVGETEAGSIDVLPFTLDPRMWRLLPDSPGYQAVPDGNDVGADVSRVAVAAGSEKTEADNTTEPEDPPEDKSGSPEGPSTGA